MKDLIDYIINDDELSAEDKSALIEKIVKASHGIDRIVTPGLYFNTEVNERTGEIDMQLWYRNVDEAGRTMHNPTGFDSTQIAEIMKNEYLSQKGNVK